MSNLSKLAMTLGMKFGPVRQGVTPRRVLEYVLTDMVMVTADKQVATDPTVLTRIEGMMEAYKDVAHYIAPSSEIPMKVMRATRNSARSAKAAKVAGTAMAESLASAS